MTKRKLGDWRRKRRTSLSCLGRMTLWNFTKVAGVTLSSEAAHLTAILLTGSRISAHHMRPVSYYMIALLIRAHGVHLPEYSRSVGRGIRKRYCTLQALILSLGTADMFVTRNRFTVRRGDGSQPLVTTLLTPVLSTCGVSNASRAASRKRCQLGNRHRSVC